jgi:hypothetical protein
MAVLIALTAICLSAAGILAGITGGPAVAIRREDRNPTLTSAAPDTATRAGHWLIRASRSRPRRIGTAYRAKALA